MAKMTLPDTQAGRIGMVGMTLYGDDWIPRTAAGLGVHRATLWRWINGTSHKVPNVDDALLSLLELERERVSARNAQIVALQKLFLVRMREAAGV